MKKLIVLFLCLTTLFIVGCGKEKVKEKSTYIVAVDPDYYPFEYIDEKDGELKGLEIDLMKELASRVNVKFEFTIAPFAGTIQDIVNKKYDFGIGYFTITEERKKSVNFLEYMTSDVVIIANSNLNSPDDKTALYAVKDGTSYIALLKEKKGVIPIEKSENSVIVERLRQKEIDYFVVDRKPGEILIKPFPELYIKEILQRDSIAIACSKDFSTEFQNKLSKALADIKADGTLDALKKKYDL